MRWRTGSASAGMVWLWLCPSGSDPVSSSRSFSQPTQPPPSHSPERRSQSALEGGAGNSALGSIHRQALSQAQPHHLSMTKYWHCRGLNSVCCFAEICNDGTHNTFCDRRIHNFIFVTQTTPKIYTSFATANITTMSPLLELRQSICITMATQVYINNCNCKWLLFKGIGILLRHHASPYPSCIPLWCIRTG